MAATPMKTKAISKAKAVLKHANPKVTQKHYKGAAK
jgi:hypothetical protein